MSRRMMIVGALVALALPVVVNAQEQPGQMVLNGSVTAVVETENGPRQYGGRMNAYLVLAGKSLEEGARVEALNVAFFGVDQAAMTGRKARGKPTGVLGFSAATRGEKKQALRYDSRRRAFVGELVGNIDMAQFSQMMERKIDPEDDTIDLPALDAKLSVSLEIGEMANLERARERPVEGVIQARMDLVSDESDLMAGNKLALAVEARYIDAQLVFWPWFEIASNLCIQPVRILSFNGGFPWFFSLSGDGLAFGQPGAATQWKKADVTFTYRDWITLFASKYSTLDSSEVFDLFDEVDVDDCIETYFVDRFSPQDMFGGGATLGSGSASAKVVSSDENADFGVDLTHLAHEFGHVLDLPHPPPVSSTNTLMCPSGFNNDNPKRNSQENKNNLSNPLLTFSLKLISPGPDCNVSADCGACP